MSLLYLFKWLPRCAKDLLVVLRVGAVVGLGLRRIKMAEDCRSLKFKMADIKQVWIMNLIIHSLNYVIQNYSFCRMKFMVNSKWKLSIFTIQFWYSRLKIKATWYQKAFVWQQLLIFPPVNLVRLQLSAPICRLRPHFELNKKWIPSCIGFDSRFLSLFVSLSYLRSQSFTLLLRNRKCARSTLRLICRFYSRKSLLGCNATLGVLDFNMAFDINKNILLFISVKFSFKLVEILEK